MAESLSRASAARTEAGALDAVAWVRKHAANAAGFEQGTASDGKTRFSLKAAHHRIIGNSRMYESASLRDGGIASVMSDAPDAKLIEQ